MPVIDEADARLEAAKATLAHAKAAQGEKASALNAARIELGNVLNTRSMEAAALAQAQSELVPAVLSGADHDEVRQRAQDAQTKIDALTSTAAILTKEAERLNVELQRHHSPVGSAQKAVEEAELYALLARYAKLIAPAIPLALEIRRRTNQWVDADSSCLLNPSDRRIGRNFKVDDDGSVYHQMS
jgi:chromosome segregation ATPase